MVVVAGRSGNIFIVTHISGGKIELLQLRVATVQNVFWLFTDGKTMGAVKRSLFLGN